MWIAQALEIVLQNVLLYPNAETALAHTQPLNPDKVHEVIYGFLQHYHLATPFIDVTRSLDAACSFCVSEERYSKPHAARLYVIDADRLRECGLRVTGGYSTRARRPAVQEALSIYLGHACDFQKKAGSAIRHVLDVEVSESERQKFYQADFYDASNDQVAREVGVLVHRCYCGDWAVEDSSLAPVSDYFRSVHLKLLAAGVPS